MSVLRDGMAFDHRMGLKYFQDTLIEELADCNVHVIRHGDRKIEAFIRDVAEGEEKRFIVAFDKDEPEDGPVTWIGYLPDGTNQTEVWRTKTVATVIANVKSHFQTLRTIN